MKNEVFREADEVQLPVTSGMKSGAAVKVGIIVGVLATDEAGGGNPAGYATVWTEGAYKFTVAFAANPGDAIYIDGTNTLTTTATSNTLFGAALTQKGATSGSLTIMIHQV